MSNCPEDLTISNTVVGFGFFPSPVNVFMCLSSGAWYPTVSGYRSLGVAPVLDMGYLRHHTHAGQLCGVGNMPLAFTQEDFLVVTKVYVSTQQFIWVVLICELAIY